MVLGISRERGDRSWTAVAVDSAHRKGRRRGLTKRSSGGAPFFAFVSSATTKSALAVVLDDAPFLSAAK